MDIIQELPSTNGFLRRAKIIGVKSVRPIDAYMLNNKMHDIIMCELASSYYPIGYFPSKHERDMALSSILNRTSNIVVLEYNKYYFPAKITDNHARTKLITENSQLITALQFAAKRIKIEKKLLHTVDAFTLLPPHILNNIRLGISFPVRQLNIASIWAKTLYSPQQLVNWGIGKLQYWTILIELNNEQFFKSSSSHCYTESADYGL